MSINKWSDTDIGIIGALVGLLCYFVLDFARVYRTNQLTVDVGFSLNWYGEFVFCLLFLISSMVSVCLFQSKYSADMDLWDFFSETKNDDFVVECRRFENDSLIGISIQDKDGIHKFGEI